MQFSDFAVGDRVVKQNQEHGQAMIDVGTLGTVTDVGDDNLWVRWDSGDRYAYTPLYVASGTLAHADGTHGHFKDLAKAYGL